MQFLVEDVRLYRIHKIRIELLVIKKLFNVINFSAQIF